MTGLIKMRILVLAAVLAGLGLRLFFILHFASPQTADTGFYTQLARNWLDHGVYGVWINGKLTPIDMRVPGYPAFLLLMRVFFGASRLAVPVAQVLLDLCTCLLIAAVASRLAPQASHRRAAIVALWMAALCPFTANYTAAILTETLATFLTALVLLVFLEADSDSRALQKAGDEEPLSPSNRWFAGGLLVGIATLVRPESPLIAVAAGLMMLQQWRRRENWPRLARAALLVAVGVVIPVLPWAARNWGTLHEVQFLAPRYSNLPGETIPRGFYAWTRTWLWRLRDVYLVPWKLEDDTIYIEDIPKSAFDSPEQREKVGDLLAQHNEDGTESQAMDDAFAQIARQRRADHPLRTRVLMPLLRGLSIWFTPRIELIPYSGDYWPVGDAWEDDRADFCWTAGLWFLNIVYVILGLAGLWIARRRPGVALLVLFVLIRTLFFTQIEAPEPRYTLECFPAAIALAAQIWSRRPAMTL